MSSRFIIIFLSAILLVACNFPGFAATGPTGPGSSTTNSVGDEATPRPLPTATPSPTPVPTIAYQPVFESASCRFTIPAGTSPECGYLLVPEDRRDPNTDTIRLHVAIFWSIGADPAPDPVIHLSGGPGSDALGIATYHFSTGHQQILANRDYIMFDQRGTGFSEPGLYCPERDDISGQLLASGLSIAEDNAQELAAFRACHDRLLAEGLDLDAYNSAASAADVNDLRIALGFDQINLYGVSYGTRLALTVMRDYPEIVRSAVLDSVYPPQSDLYVEWPASADRAFNELFEACAADPTCNTSFPDLENVLYQTTEALNANPLIVPVTDPATGTTYNAVVDGNLFIDVLFGAMYRHDVIPSVPWFIYQINQRNPGTMLPFRLGLYFDRTTSRGQTLSVQCNEETSFSSVEVLEQAASGVPASIRDNYVGELSMLYEACEFWGAGVGNPIENRPVNVNIPSLIFAGRFDPITPPEWGAEAAATLGPNTYFYEFPAAGHWILRTGQCPWEITLDFLDDPLSSPNASCFDGLGPPAFVN